MRWTLFILLLFGALASAEQPKVSYLTFGSGISNVLRNKKSAEFRLEYKSWRNFNHIKPFGGVTVTTLGALYAYGGFVIDIAFWNKLVFSPNFAVGVYSKGHGKDLGYPLEFRSNIELGWQFKNYSRIGLSFYHISNASLGKKNPGTESLVFFYSLPLKF